MSGTTAEEVRPRILAIGDLMVDVTVLMSAEIARGTDTPARIRTGWGGSAANVAAWLAATGTPAAFLGRVGADAFGRAAVEELRMSGVTVYGDTAPGLPTGTCIVLVHPDGERSMLPDPGSNATLRPEHLDADAFGWATHVHLSAYTLFDPQRRAAGLAALSRAQERGLSVSVDAASAGPLEAAGADHFVEWTTGADLLLANDTEAQVLAAAGPAGRGGTWIPGQPPPEQSVATTLITHYPAVVVKLGARGAMYTARGGGAIWVEGPVVDVVDTTGAGDAFAAGFLAAWLSGQGPKTALDAGAALAARAVAQVGARPRR
jgi:sugar/nucleoside kinase (ribokinase family)